MKVRLNQHNIQVIQSNRNNVNLSKQIKKCIELIIYQFIHLFIHHEI